jgi:acetyl esterase/lipase
MSSARVCCLLVALGVGGAVTAGEVRANRHVYGKDAPAAQVLDAHLVPGEKPAPVLVYIVSGGWTSHPPDEIMPGVFEAYHDFGYSVIAVCHRTVDGHVSWPAPADDVSRAIQFVRLHADEWSIDPDRIAIAGRSSGGHVAMMVGFGEDRADPDSDDPVARQSSAVRCVIEHGGPTDLAVHIKEMLAAAHVPEQSKEYVSGRFRQVLGIGREPLTGSEIEQRLYAISPIRLVDEHTVPVLMLYSGPEGVASADDPRLQWETHTPLSGFLLAEKLKQSGVAYDWSSPPNSGGIRPARWRPSGRFWRSTTVPAR